MLLISCSHHTVKEKDNAESYLSNGSHHHISFLFKNHLYSLNFVAVSRFGETRGIQFPVKKKRVIWAISITTHDSKLTFFTRFVILRHSFSTVSSPFGWVVLLSSDTDHHFLLPPHPIPSHSYKTETAISDAAKSTHDKLMCSFHFGNPDSMQSNKIIIKKVILLDLGFPFESLFFPASIE